jgi:hypothetical protein
MKLRILILVLIAFIGSLAEEKKAENKPQPKVKDAVLEAILPEGAKQIAPYKYRYTDPEGKAWIYRRTPFGVMKFEEKYDETTTTEAPANMRAFEEGDSIRFERPTPFGTMRWTRKKSELNDVEKAAWERELRREKEKSDQQKDER